MTKTPTLIAALTVALSASVASAALASAVTGVMAFEEGWTPCPEKEVFARSGRQQNRRVEISLKK